MEETVGARIERIAKEKGLGKSAALAKSLGVSYETLRKWRAGEIVPNRNRQARIAAYLQVEIKDFLHAKPPQAEPIDELAAWLLKLYNDLPLDRRMKLIHQAEALQVHPRPKVLLTDEDAPALTDAPLPSPSPAPAAVKQKRAL